jgi:DeoR/GlpR family transcriptional regulator of sugar metabolism
MSAPAERRREWIVRELADNLLIKVSDLCERFGISKVSIRRDLVRLEQPGLLKRVHGGAVVIPSPVFPSGPRMPARWTAVWNRRSTADALPDFIAYLEQQGVKVILV